MMVKLHVGQFLSSAAVLAALVSACGVYTLNPKGKSDIGSIFVQRLENETSQYELTDRLTEFIIDAFISDGNMKILPESKADAVLVGVLTRYERVPHVYNENDEVEKYKVLMAFEVSLKNPRDDSEIWKERINQEGIYDAATETEIDGQQRAGERLVEAIINKTTKSW
jgi:hypothetical protein